MKHYRAFLVAVALLSATTAAAYDHYEGTWSAYQFHGSFTQWGGTATVSFITHPVAQNFHQDTITIHDGLFISDKINIGLLNGNVSFTQNGGLHVNSNGITLATSMLRYVNRRSWYTMNGGRLETPFFGGSGSYTQTGGRTIAERFGLTAGGSANIEDGTLNCSSIAVAGVQAYSHPGGSGYARSRFNQVGGNVSTGDFWVGGGGYVSVEGGSLTASNMSVVGVALVDPYMVLGGPRRAYALFEQRGGEIVLDRRLDVETTYTLESGSLTAPVISVVGQFTAKSSAIVNKQGLILRGGKFEAYVPCHLGPLVLRTNGAARTVSEISFYGPATVQFRNSRNLWWSPGAYLVVKGWRGLAEEGGGDNQLRVGDNPAGLTRDQLRRIVFENPANLPFGDYSARMLTTGEVVPNAPRGMHVTRGNTRMMLAWPEPYYLETTTNLTGRSQWMIVTQASPLTVKFSDPQRFFRLRRY